MLSTTLKFKNAAIGNDASILNEIHIHTKNIAIYQRDVLPINTPLYNNLKQSIECRASGRLKEIETSLYSYFSDILPDHKNLFDDISHLLMLFEALTKASSFRLLLATVNSNMCRRFHTDINDLRLLCTYVGQGTLWLPDDSVNEKALITGGDNEEIVKDEKLVQQAGMGDVVILKGGLYPNAIPILHRSPTIEDTGETRLLLRIDTNEPLDLLS